MMSTYRRHQTFCFLTIALMFAGRATASRAQVGPDALPVRFEVRPPNPVVKRETRPITASRRGRSGTTRRINIADQIEDALEKGNAARDKKQYELAETNYRRALELDAKEARAHSGLGNVYYDQKLYREAAGSYEEVLKLKPKDVDALMRVGFLYHNLGEYGKAVEKFGGVVTARPDFAYAPYLLAWNQLYRNKGAPAAEAAQKYLELNKWKDLYGVLIAYLGFRQANQQAEADTFLNQATSKIKGRDWPYPVVRYLRKELTSDQLLALATDQGKMTEARTYIGLDISLPDHSKDALEHLLWVKANGNREYFEYPLAVEELGRIQR